MQSFGDSAPQDELSFLKLSYICVLKCFVAIIYSAAVIWCLLQGYGYDTSICPRGDSTDLLFTV